VIQGNKEEPLFTLIKVLAEIVFSQVTFSNQGWRPDCNSIPDVLAYKVKHNFMSLDMVKI
jgi:hypothetical protein